MSGAESMAGEFRPCGADLFGGAADLLTHLRGAVTALAGGRGPGGRGEAFGTRQRGGPWGGRERGGPWGGPRGGRGGPGGPKEWPGGMGGGWWPGPPGPPRPPKAGRGDVRAAILALLREGPRNGYQIMSEIEERSEGAWRPSPGAVYPALQQLADEGLIEAEESGGRRTFRLTGDGGRYVEENPQAARAAWESMTDGGDTGEVPGLFVQAAKLGGSIVQMAHAGSPDQLRAAEQLLERTRRGMYQILADEADDEQDEQ